MLSVVLCLPAQALDLDPDVYSQLHYRSLGVPGNRADAVVGVPGNSMIAYVGASSGGIWMTTDGGVHWEPVFDDQPVQSIGALAVAPSATNQVWAGTGESFYIRPTTSIGNGIYKSTDGGHHWQHMGLEKTGRIGVIQINPHDPDIVYACATGDGFGPQKQRGVFRTKDGGKTWKKVLFVNPYTGCSDLSMDAHDPQTLFAAMWQWNVKPWNLDSGGPGSGIYVSHDGGTTWKKIEGHGLPTHDVGKGSVQVAPSDSERVYALLEGAGFYRSEDGGRSWKRVNQSHDIQERPGYYTRFRVAPDDENRIYFMSVRVTMSRDGGETIERQPYGGDNHDVWIDPKNPDRMMIANDGGALITLNRFDSWKRVVLPIAQIYHVYTDNAVPYNVYGNRQDGYSYRGPSNSVRRQGITNGLWEGVGGCESGFTVPETNYTGYSGCYAGGLQYYNAKTDHVRDIRVWPMAAYGWPPAKVKLRWNWTFPIAISPFTQAVFVGSQYVHKSTNHGQSWTRISPDLTRNDKSRQQSSGGITTDNLMTFSPETLSAIALSPVKKGVIWAGSFDGLVHVTTDGGKHWRNVTDNIPGLDPWGKVSNIEPSHFKAGTAYIAVDRHLMGDNTPYIYKTTDYGDSWSRISDDIPDSKLSYVHNVAEDPARPGMLYAGTDNSVYFTLDDGDDWHRLQTNLPHAPAYWLTIQPRRSDLVLATYGRGIWILDDITPLRALNEDVLDDNVHLFKPRSAYRFHDKQYVAAAPNNPVRGHNPPGLADINYYLKKAPKGEIKLAIYAPSGKLVRHFSSKDGTLPNKAGINRLWWDLRYAPAKTTHLKTPPPGEAWDKPPVAGEDRHIVSWDLDLSQKGPLVAPGTYTVKLTVDGKTISKPLVVMKDPNTQGTQQDIEKQVALALNIRNDLNRTVALINRIELMRKQLALLETTVEGKPRYADVAKQAKEMEDKLIGVEGKLFDIHLTGAREDAFRNPMYLYGRLSALLEEVENVSTDFAPTDQQYQVYKILDAGLETMHRAFRNLKNGDLRTFNRMLQDKGLAGIAAPPAG